VPIVGILVDTSVWSLALRRDQPPDTPELAILDNAIESGSDIYSTGFILQELLQGFSGPKAQSLIVDRFAAIPMLVPETTDYVEAAGLRNQCRRKGIQVGTIDALIAQLALHYDLSVLTTDKDFENISSIILLNLNGKT